MSTPNVTRDQLLKAQEIVQLANIVEELRRIKLGGDGTALEERITELNTRIETLTSDNNVLSQALNAANALITQLQAQLGNTDPDGEPTPDTVNEVFNAVGITD